ncbi:aminotransferase class III-fold pyridoxal phosphate-dependent enzyme [Angustibacter sp. McL0619]|uniref:aminotransferase class III-fold pyridoxal phosphate-dependent enzyme n=1 Tax=Angustibacter sp. McL0619 TaxID=3415676 RepID=UPI003CF5D454
MSGAAGGAGSGIDAVLLAKPPAFSEQSAAAMGEAAFGIAAAGARNLGSERDQTFMLLGDDGTGLAILKVSNPAEDPATLDMEALVAFHAVRADPALAVAQPRRSPAALPDAGAAGFRVRWDHDGDVHWLRVYDLLPGRARLDPRTLADPALVAWGHTTARLGRALRSFIHPNAIRTLPWDVQHASTVRPMLASIADRSTREAVEAVLDRFERTVLPRWSGLRAQVIHTDLTADNVLADDDGLITGIIDFGDLSHTALVVDLASVLDSMALGRPGEEMFRVARLVLDGYEHVVPLEPLEREVMGEIWAARAAVGVAIGSWRAAEGLEEPGFAERLNETALVMMDHMLTTGWERTALALGARDDSRGGSGTAVLSGRRDAVFGPAMEPLSYDEPVEMASASGVWMQDTEGRRYLDAYNNVVCVGHSHPRVTSAVARQWRVLNTNMRYLHHAAIELGERLVQSCPPELDTVLFVNSGSEANDLAWRIAKYHTGNQGGLCTDFAYHGITESMADLSPEVLPAGVSGAQHVETWLPPDAYRGLHPSSDEFAAALARLAARDVAPAAVILDGVLQSDGVLDLEPAYVQELVRLTHESGGLWIADEVQGGHGRTGSAMWSFERFGIVPDFVTLGKPMGNGQPVGAVILRRELAERFARDTVFFSTFAGNQVSMVASHAVLDVLADERVLPRVEATGDALRKAVREATAGHDRVGDVRGVGLANGIEIVTDRTSRRPDPEAAAAVKNGMRARGVLVGTTGRAVNTLKVRPPLAFTEVHIPTFVAALTGALDELPSS